MKKTRKHIKNQITWRRHRTLSREITLLTVFSSVCAMLLLGLALMFIFVFFFAQKAREDMEYVIVNTNQQFQDKLQFIEDGAVSLRHNTILRDFFQKNHYNEEEMETQLSYSMDLFSQRNAAGKGIPFVQSVYLFNNRDKCVQEEYYPMTVSALEQKDQEYYSLQQEFKKSGQQYLCVSNGENLDLFFRIYNDNMKETGICIVVLDKRAVQLLFENMESYNNSVWAVTDSQGALIAGGGKETALKALGQIETGYLGKTSLDGVSALCGTQDCGFGIRTAVAVGTGNIFNILRPTLFTFLAVLVLALFLVGAVVFGISYRFTKPLKEVAEGIAAFGQGNLDTRMEDFSVQEFHDISVTFNEMAERIKYLITQVYEKQLLATRSQVKYLQSQINPHFQFNILAMLSLKAKLAGNEELYQNLRAFSKLMQGKIFREKEIKIPLADEIELVEFYLMLQNSRYQDKISYEIHYEKEDVKKCLIPRLLIQPLVENAVSHGLEPKNGDGKILVEIGEKEGCLHIVVEDNGVGFDTEALEKEQPDAGAALGEIEHTHMGLANTKRLIQILYGEEYGMKITGKKGEGTRVEVVLPAERGKEDVEGDGRR